jgi:hypothetical protein
MRRLPVYATGVGFTALLVAVADAHHWSGLTTFLAALGVAAFYTVMILVPWLIREQLDEAGVAGEPEETLYRAALELIPRNGTNGASRAHTNGPPIAKHTHPRVTTP